jgi:alpha-1,2-mannosyltransferase
MSLAAALPTGRSSAADEFSKLALALCILALGLELGYLLYCRFPYDPLGYLVGRDFVNTWIGAKLALGGHPGDYFDVQVYNKLLVENFGAGFPIHIWSYPPHLLLFTWPLGFLPYMAAYMLYCGLGLIFYVLVVNDGPPRFDRLVLLALAPAALANVAAGQNGFLLAVLLIGGLLQLEKRPVLAGILFGILTVKPQLGLLLPIVLVLTRKWQVIGVAAATAAVLLALTALVFGPDVWWRYWHDAMPTQTQLVFGNFENYMIHMPTMFMNARVAGLSVAVAGWIQALVSALSVAAVVWTFWRRRDPELSLALLITATFTVSPYAFNYDMVLLSTVIVRLMDRSDNDRLDYALMLVVWIMPVALIGLGMFLIPGSAASIVAFGARLFWRMWQQEGQGGSSEFRPAVAA